MKEDEEKEEETILFKKKTQKFIYKYQLIVRYTTTDHSKYVTELAKILINFTYELFKFSIYLFETKQRIEDCLDETELELISKRILNNHTSIIYGLIYLHIECLPKKYINKISDCLDELFSVRNVLNVLSLYLDCCGYSEIDKYCNWEESVKEEETKQNINSDVFINGIKKCRDQFKIDYPELSSNKTLEDV